MKGIKYILVFLAIGFLSLGLGGCEYTYPFEEEPNNIPDDATFVRNQIVKGQIHVSTDIDYWEINTGGHEGSYDVRLNHLMEDLKLIVSGYDAYGTQITLDGTNYYLYSDNLETEDELVVIPDGTVSTLIVCIEVSDRRGLPGSYWLEHHSYR